MTLNENCKQKNTKNVKNTVNYQGIFLRKSEEVFGFDQTKIFNFQKIILFSKKKKILFLQITTAFEQVIKNKM